MKNGDVQHEGQQARQETQYPSAQRRGSSGDSYKVFVSGRTMLWGLLIAAVVVRFAVTIFSSDPNWLKALEEYWFVAAVVFLVVYFTLRRFFLLLGMFVVSKPAMEIGPDGLLIRDFRARTISWDDILAVRVKENVEDSLRGAVGSMARVYTWTTLSANISRRLGQGIILEMKEGSNYPEVGRDAFTKKAIYLIPMDLIGGDIYEVASIIDEYRLEHSAQKA